MVIAAYSYTGRYRRSNSDQSQQTKESGTDPQASRFAAFAFDLNVDTGGRGQVNPAIVFLFLSGDEGLHLGLSNINRASSDFDLCRRAIRSDLKRTWHAG